MSNYKPVPIYSYPDEVARQWKEERDLLQSKLDKALASLEFYSDKNTWQAYGTIALEDNGDRARQAIAEIRGAALEQAGEK